MSIPVVLDEKSFCLAMRKTRDNKLEVSLSDFCGTELSPEPWVRDFNSVDNYLDLLRYSVLLLDNLQEFSIDSFFVGCPDSEAAFNFPLAKESQVPVIEARPLMWPHMLTDILIDIVRLGMQKGFVFMNNDYERLFDCLVIARNIADALQEREETFLVVASDKHLFELGFKLDEKTLVLAVIPRESYGAHSKESAISDGTFYLKNTFALLNNYPINSIIAKDLLCCPY